MHTILNVDCYRNTTMDQNLLNLIVSYKPKHNTTTNHSLVQPPTLQSDLPPRYTETPVMPAHPQPMYLLPPFQLGGQQQQQQKQGGQWGQQGQQQQPQQQQQQQSTNVVVISGVTTIGHGWTKSRGPPSARGPPSSRHIFSKRSFVNKI